MSIRAASFSSAAGVRKAAGSWARFTGSVTTAAPMVKARFAASMRAW
jgi:hypothetical protein